MSAADLFLLQGAVTWLRGWPAPRTQHRSYWRQQRTSPISITGVIAKSLQIGDALAGSELAHGREPRATRFTPPCSTSPAPLFGAPASCGRLNDMTAAVVQPAPEPGLR